MENLLFGKVIDNYRIMQVIGRGGMGVVYKAEDVNLEKIMALKMIDPMLAQEKSFLKRFRTEARALAKLENSNIVTVHALRETEYGLFMVMEFVEGQTLSEWIDKNGSMPIEEAIPIFKQILTAVGYAHHEGIIHRDIKPGNIILTPQGEIKIMDFGLAKIQHGPESTITRGAGGTLKYISPEQAQNIGDVDHRSDIYSIGMTFYEILAGRTPFGDRDSEYSILKSIVEKKFPPPNQFNPDMPKSLNEIIMKTLEKEPEKRFQSANEMLKAIKRFERFEKLKVLEKSTVRLVQKKNTIMDNLSRSRKPVLIAISCIIAIILFILIIRGFSTRTSVSIASQPDGAAIYLDESYIGDTPIHNYNLNAGNFNLRIQKSNYFIIDTLIAIEKDQHERLIFQLEPSARVAIKIKPENAQVVIDGRSIDPANLTDFKLLVGLHEIRINLDGYKTVYDQIRFEQGINPTLEYTLEPLNTTKSSYYSTETKPTLKSELKKPSIAKVGDLQLTSEPTGATIWIDGRFEGTTPKKIQKLKIGLHKILIAIKGFEEYSTNVQVKNQQLRYVHARLIPLKMITVKIIAIEPSGKPVFGNIFVDHKNTNRFAPQELSLSVGLHRIEVRKDGYMSEVKTTNLNQDVKLTFILKKKF